MLYEASAAAERVTRAKVHANKHSLVNLSNNSEQFFFFFS